MSQEHTVIVGAGVAGLYAAWRLLGSGHDPTRLRLLETSDRAGGRLWSLKMRSSSALPAELGGMFFNDQQPLVYDLCARVFDLDRQPVTPKPDFAWLRSRRFLVDQFQDPDILPYNLAPDEQHLSYYALLLLAIERIAPDIRQHWPFTPDGNREDSLAYLQALQIDGRPLHEWGFWNLMSRVLSNEAWLALRDIISSYALFANWNGYDALVSIVLEQSGNWYRLTHGYQNLPERLAHEVEQAGVGIEYGRTLRGIQRQGDGLRLTVGGGDGPDHIDTARLVLAVPKRALVDLVGASPDLQGTPMAEQLDAVDGIPACKIFLTFDRPWWRKVPEGPGRVREDTYAVSHTDLPLRQCYYLGVDEHSGEGLMLASYADGQAESFWQALMADSGRGRELKSPLSEQALHEVCRQLSQMHGVPVPRPKSGVFVNWTRWPYGGGWHAWQPGWKSWELVGAMQRPVAGLPVYLCGETYSSAQGWVQGALESTEALLEGHFGLETPGWLSDASCLVPYHPTGE